jgi:hypothetical protein
VARWRFDSDEPQHLHVVWGWTHGLVQYRDVFDNHMPLFHLASAPLLLAVGERPGALVAMRAALLPVWALSVVAVWRIARAIAAPAAARWTAVLAAGTPGFFLGSLEYRPDVPWTLAWLVALAVAVRPGPFHTRRAVGLGLVLGAAFAISIKTAFMLLAFAVATPVALLLGPWPVPGPLRMARLVAAGAAGFVVVPGVIAGVFAAERALPALLEGTVLYNALPSLGLWGRDPLRATLFVPAVVLLAAVARPLTHAAPDTATGARRAFVFLAGGVYAATVLCVSPLLDWETALPVLPLLPLVAVPPLFAACTWLGRPRAAWVGAALAAGVEIAVALGHRDLRENLAQPELGVVSDVLRLTTPDEPVMDVKGEAVFRRRPFFYPLEQVTQARMALGLIPDDIPERLVATRTHVALGDSRQFPSRAREFLTAHYVPVGRLRVAGTVLDPATTGGEIHFDLPIPGEYTLVGEGGPPRGLLDGVRWDETRHIAAGPHSYLPAVTDGRIGVVWAPAVARGFVPALGPAPAAQREPRAAR